MVSEEPSTFTTSGDYQLLDFGLGRKLERWGPWLLDRRAPAAEGQTPSVPQLWRQAAARYLRDEGVRGRWAPAKRLPESWAITLGGLRLLVRPTEFGHLGVFPEHAAHWPWLAEQLAAVAARRDEPPKVLNLFAYTGATTLAAAQAGARLVHLDASRSVVAWARENAAANGLAQAPIRWIVDDARDFVEREVRRQRRYDGIVLDPPSYGHGPKGKAWRLEDHLPPLLRSCRRLLAEDGFMLLSAHTLGFEAPRLAALLVEAQLAPQQPPLAQELGLDTADGRRLICGASARVGA